MGCLYKLTSPSGKAYIGISSKTMDARWAKHVEHALGKRSNGYLYAALRKYGTDAFQREVLAECIDWAALCQMEIDAIKAHETLWPHGYNLTHGGEGFAGRVMTEATRAKISVAQKKRYERPEERARLLGWSTKAREERSVRTAKKRLQKKEQQAIYVASPEFKALHSESVKSAMRRPDVAAKVQAAARARASSPDWKRKVSEAKKGVSTGPCSDQRKRLIVEARKREWADPVIRARRLAGFAKAREAKAAAKCA